MLLLLFLVAGVTNTLAEDANVTISPTTGNLVAALTTGDESGFAAGFTSMWRHEQLPLTFTVSDFCNITDGGELKQPAGNMTSNGAYLVVDGGVHPNSYMCLSLPKGYRFTGYKIVLANNLVNKEVNGTNHTNTGNKVFYETTDLSYLSSTQSMDYDYVDDAGQYSSIKSQIQANNPIYPAVAKNANDNFEMQGSNESNYYTIERTSQTEDDMDNHLYFRLSHSSSSGLYGLTIISFEVWFTAEGTFDAEVNPAGTDVVRSVVTAPFKTSKIDVGAVERRTKNGRTFFAYSYENVHDLDAYNIIYQANAVVNGEPTQGDEEKHIHPVKVNGQNQYAFGNDTYYVETPVSIHTSSGLEAPIGYRIVGAKFNYLWGPQTSGGTRTIDNAYYITRTRNNRTYYLNDQLQFTTTRFMWSYDSEANNLYTGTGDNIRYLSCEGSGDSRTLTTSSEKGGWYNLNVFTRNGTTYIGWDNDDSNNRYYLRSTSSGVFTVRWTTTVERNNTNNAAHAESAGSQTVDLASYNPGAYTLKVYDKEGNYAEDSEGNPTKGLKAVVDSQSDAGGTLELEGLNNDAVKFQITGLETGKQALVSVTLQLEALNPFINSMNIVCEDTPKDLQMTQTFSASDFKVSGGKFTFYVPEEYKDSLLSFKFDNLYSDYGDKTYYNNAASIHNSRYSFVNSSYFESIDGNEDGGLYDSAYNPDATYENKIVATKAGNIRFKFNNAEDLTNTQTNTNRKYLEETPFSVADYLGSDDPDGTTKKGAFDYVKLKASSTTQKSGTFYVFTADETRYNIAPGSTATATDEESGEETTVTIPHAWQHRSYAFYRMDIEVQAKTFTPNLTWTKVYDYTSYEKDSKDAEDSMWGLKLNTTDVGTDGKQGYLTANQVITEATKMLDENNEDAPASLNQVLYVDASDLLALVNTNAASIETLKGNLGVNALTFLPENTTSTLDNVAVKTTSGSYRAGRNIVLTDKQPFYSPFDIQVGSANYASYTRDITTESTGMVKNNTVMLPFTLALEDGVHTNAEGTPGAGTQFTVNTMAADQTLQKEKGQDYGTAYFVKYTEKTTEANKPYMIKLESFADEAENKIFIASQTGSLVLATTTGTELEGDGSTGKYYVGEENVNASSDKENFVLTNKGSYSGMKFDRADDEKVFYFANDKYLDLRTLTNKKRYLYSYPFRAAYAYTSETKTNGAKGLRGFFISYDEPQGGTTGIEDATTEADLMVRAGNGYITLTATRAQAVAIHAISGVSMNRIQMNAGETQVVNLPAGIYVVNNVKIVVK